MKKQAFTTEDTESTEERQREGMKRYTYTNPFYSFALDFLCFYSVLSVSSVVKKRFRF